MTPEERETRRAGVAAAASRYLREIEDALVYFDGVHLASRNLDLLHSTAEDIGHKREWFQNHPKHPHYDVLTPTRVNKLLALGAVFVGSKELFREVYGR